MLLDHPLLDLVILVELSNSHYKLGLCIGYKVVKCKSKLILTWLY